MPEPSILALFAAACLALAITPGPDMLLVASRSLSQGRAAGFATLAGIQVGIYGHALAAALGLSQLFVLVPLAYDVVRYAGAAYLLWLAWRAIRAPAPAASAPPGLRRAPVGAMFRQGLLTNLLNPKVALFVLALFPQFLRPEAGSVLAQSLVLATVLNVIGATVNGAVILAAGRIGRTLSGGRLGRAPQFLLGTVFAGLAARLAFEGHR
ncbi:MAG TPA: LysE family translocator [Roseomonas sp.]|nr:LysE family translocator [Roseomonas sp.]